MILVSVGVNRALLQESGQTALVEVAEALEKIESHLVHGQYDEQALWLCLHERGSMPKKRATEQHCLKLMGRQTTDN